MDRKVCSCCRSLAAAIGKYIAKAEDDLAKELDRMGYAESSDSVKRAGQLEDELAETLTEQTNRIVEFFKKFVSLEAAMELLAAFFDADAARSAMQEIFENYYEKNIPKLANVYIKETDGSLAVSRIRKRTTAWITEWSAALSDMMNLTSEQQIESLLKEAVQNGEGVDAFTRRLMDSGIRNEEWRARRAAITEMLRAHSVAQHEAMIQDASVVWKKWVHTGNYRMEPRKNHLKMHGQTVLKEKPYKLHGIKGGIYYPMYPRDTVLPPEESVSCHCLSQPVVDEDVLGMPLEERQRLQQQIIEEDDGKWMEELDVQNKAKAGINEENTVSYEGIPKTWQRLSDDADVSAVNPTGNEENCVNCTIAYEMRSRGYAVVANDKLKKLERNPFSGWVSPDIKKVAAQDDALSIIRKDMEEWGEGSRAQIAVIWNQTRKKSGIWDTNAESKGHSFIAEQRKETTVFIDAQTGKEYTDDIFKTFSDNPVEYCRIDNLKTNDLGATACKKE